MLKGAKFLRACFAFEALLLFANSGLFLWAYGRGFARNGYLPPAVTEQFCIWVAAPLVLAAIFAKAWWSLSKGKSSARAWAIAASLTNTVGGIALTYWSHGRLWILAGVGVWGLLVFASRSALTQFATTPRLPGDGTSQVLDKIASLAGFAAVLIALGWLSRWATANGLPSTHGIYFFLLVLLAQLIATAAHELGHTSVGWAFRMRLRSFLIGPFDWRIRSGKWTFQFHAANLLFAGGGVSLVPVSLHYQHRREIYMLAAGPLASLWLGWIAACAALTAKGHPWEPAWELFALIAIVSLVGFAINLIPLRPDANYSDGARIYQILSGGPWADVYRVYAMVGSSVVSPLRPKDFDIQTIQRAALFVKDGPQGLLLRLFAYQHFFECGQTPEALAALAEAEAIFDRSPAVIPVELYPEFIFANALLKRDSARARVWSDRLKGKKLARLGPDFWRGMSALSWLENHPAEALTAWEKGNALAQQLPAAGGYEFDRFCYAQLREALNNQGQTLNASAAVAR